MEDVPTSAGARSPRRRFAAVALVIVLMAAGCGDANTSAAVSGRLDRVSAGGWTATLELQVSSDGTIGVLGTPPNSTLGFAVAAVEGGHLSQVSPPSISVTEFAWGADSSLWLTASKGDRTDLVHVVPATGAEVVVPTARPFYSSFDDGGITVSPDGKSAVIGTVAPGDPGTRSNISQLTEVDLTTGAMRALLPVSRTSAYQPCFVAPDTVAFLESDGASRSLEVVNLDGSGRRTLVDHDPSIYEMSCDEHGRIAISHTISRTDISVLTVDHPTPRMVSTGLYANPAPYGTNGVACIDGNTGDIVRLDAIYP